MTSPDLPVPRTVLVTGGARRVGRSIALALAADGWAVGVHYHRSAEAALDLVASLRASGANAAAIPGNLANEAEVAAILPAAEAALGPIGCLINNASTFEYDSAFSADRASWDFHMETNLRAPFVLTQDFARRLPETCRGVVINIIDQRVWNLTPHFVSYTVSKAGLWTLTQTLALALAPRIRVNAVGPGPTLPSTRQTDAQFARQCAETPLQHGTSPIEIADAIRFILNARAMTGQMIALDGGQHLGWAPARPIGPVEE